MENIITGSYIKLISLEHKITNIKFLWFFFFKLREFRHDLVEILSMIKTVAKIIPRLGTSRVISVKRRNSYLSEYIVPNSQANEELMQKQQNKNKYFLCVLFLIWPSLFPALLLSSW